MSQRLCAVSVDLDEIHAYYLIHGLFGRNESPSRHAVYNIAVPRLLEWAKQEQIPLTLFAVGADLERAAAAEALKRARELGHEIGNHTLDHRYDLVRLSSADMRDQVEGGADAIASAVGERPVGFRAPGYTITDDLFAILKEAGVGYDSSVFPCPVYYGAKAAAIGWISLRGRRSRSIVDNPSVLLAPTRPYRIGSRYFMRGEGMLELPIQVTRGLRLPLFGTSITAAGPAKASLLTRMCVGEPLVNIELHGIDVLDENDGLQDLAPFQFDVRVPLSQKLASLSAVVKTMRRADYRFVTLRDAAKTFS